MFCFLDKLLKLNRLMDQSINAAAAAANSKMDAIKIKSQLRRVMSDRALKIVKCSQTKVTTKLTQQQNDLSNSSVLACSQSDLSSSSMFSSKLNSRLMNSSVLSNKSSPLNNSTNLSQNNHKITLLPIKTVDLKDKESLIEHIKTVYNDTIDSDGNSLVLGVQSIINSILHFIKSNENENITVNDVLNEHLFQSIIKLNLKYQDDKTCDKMRIEGQMQILLKIEDLIQKQNLNKTTPLDEDDVWEIANLIRWLNQLFKDKFKIEKFLFGEIYSTYFASSSEFVLSLMEELGYSNDDNDNDSDSDSDTENTTATNNDSINNKTTNNDDSVISNASSTATTTTTATNNNLNTSDSAFDATKNAFDNDDDLLNESRRKKLKTRFPSSTLNTSRSIMVQKKRLHLKIRSPYKSPTKCGSRQWLPNSDYIRRSPRLKGLERPSLKRPNHQYSITDTPIHKQNSTRITTRQQRIIKKISFQKFKSETIIIPDTPEKNKNDTNNRFIIRASPSPKKMRFN